MLSFYFQVFQRRIYTLWNIYDGALFGKSVTVKLVNYFRKTSNGKNTSRGY